MTILLQQCLIIQVEKERKNTGGEEGVCGGVTLKVRELIVGLRKSDDLMRYRISLKRNKDSNGANTVKEYREG